jgi:hypothetical protein
LATIFVARYDCVTTAIGQSLKEPAAQGPLPLRWVIKEPKMNEQALNMSLRKFLKIVGVTSQQEIEKAIRAALVDGRLKGAKTVDAQMVLTIGKVGLNHKVDGTIELE